MATEAQRGCVEGRSTMWQRRMKKEGAMTGFGAKEEEETGEKKG
jgi:hypothetical protein